MDVVCGEGMKVLRLAAAHGCDRLVCGLALALIALFFEYGGASKVGRVLSG